MSSCDLCEAAPITRRYFEDETCWIADCEICLVPMVVWTVHDPRPADEIKADLHAKLAEVANPIFGENGWKVDDNMRNIPDHYHAHARPPHFWLR